MASQFSFRKIRSLQQLRSVIGKDTTIETPQSQQTSRILNSALLPLPTPEAPRKLTRITTARGQPNRQETKFLELLINEGWTFIAYEAVKIRLAHQCWYTPDILAWKPKEKITFFEVKGFWEDDARVKVKVAARLLPKQFSIRTARYLKGTWQIKHVVDTASARRTIPPIELLHPATGSHQLSVPISTIHPDPATGQLEISVPSSHLENALYRYVLFLETGKMPDETLSRPKKKAALQILAQSQSYAIDIFRSKWEEAAFARYSKRVDSPFKRLHLHQ